MQKVIDVINLICDRLLPDWLIKMMLDFCFSKPSFVLHTIWFAWWFMAKLDVSLLTNVVSLEAIYIGILIGIQQSRQHKAIKKHIEKQSAK